MLNFTTYFKIIEIGDEIAVRRILPKILFPNFLRFRAETAGIVTFFCRCSMKNRKDTLLMVSVALHIASKSSRICSLLIIIESYNVSNNSILHL